jgi:hypothetical protein
VLKEAAYRRRVYTITLMAQAHAPRMTRREQLQFFRGWWGQITHEEKVAALQRALRPALGENAARKAREFVRDDRRQTWGRVLQFLQHYGEADAFLKALTRSRAPSVIRWARAVYAGKPGRVWTREAIGVLERLSQDVETPSDSIDPALWDLRRALIAVDDGLAIAEERRIPLRVCDQCKQRAFWKRKNTKACPKCLGRTTKQQRWWRRRKNQKGNSQKDALP